MALRYNWVLRLCDLLQVLITLVLLGAAFQGRGSHAVFVAVWLLLPLLRLLGSSSYRARLTDRYRRYWKQCQAFSDGKGTIPWIAAFYWVMLPTLLLVLLNGRTQSAQDNLPVMLSAGSLALKGNAELSEFLNPLPGQIMTHEGICPSHAQYPYFLGCTPRGVYSSYPMGMIVVALPFTLAVRVLGGNARAISALRTQKWAAAWMAAVTVGLFFILALCLGKANVALLVTALVALGSAVFSTVGQGLWTQDGVTVFFLAALFLEFFRERFPLGGVVLGQALALSLMFACRLTSLPLIGLFGLWLLIRDYRRALITGTLLLVFASPWSYFYRVTYGSFFGPQAQWATDSLWSLNFWPLLTGVLFSPSHGLIPYQPWILLLALGCFPKAREALRKEGARRAVKGWPCFFAAAALSQIGMLSFWTVWHGGYCFGSRLLTEILPLLALLLVPMLSRVWSWRWVSRVSYSLFVLSFLIHANGVYLKGWAWQDQPPAGSSLSVKERFWSWRYAGLWYPLFGR